MVCKASTDITGVYIYIYIAHRYRQLYTDLVYYSQGICAGEAGGLSVSYIYICIALDVAIKLIWCTHKSRHLCLIDQGGLSASYIYMHCDRCSN